MEEKWRRREISRRGVGKGRVTFGGKDMGK